jgi:murein DD-endopeptidase MepM/ murein hydrolase activator NlpD
MTPRWKSLIVASALLVALLLAFIPRTRLGGARAGTVRQAAAALSSTADSTAPAGSPAPPPHTAPFACPIDLPPAMSATFAEYRPGHFHAGVDFSTGGREGIPVLAIEDGQIVRVRASGLGYGRAIYLETRGGKLAVYAHLSSFMPELASYVGAVQDSLGRYRVDLTPPAGRFRVKRGQVLGRSGSSGAGGPHFHFEMREADIAINPLSHGVRVPDASPPTLIALNVVPLDAWARVNGLPTRVRAPLAQQTGGELAPAREISIEGRVGLSIQGYDRATAAPDNHLGIYRLELWLDGERIFASRYDRFDYLRNHEVEAQYDYEEVLSGRRSVQNLFVPPGVVGDFYGGLAAGAGVLDAGSAARAAGPSGRAGERPLSPGIHALRIVAADAAGNERQARATLRVLPARASGDSALAARAHASSTAAEPRLAAGDDQPPKASLTPAGRAVQLELEFGSPLAAPPHLLVPGVTELTAVGTGRYRARVPADGATPIRVAGQPWNAGGEREWLVDLPWVEARTGSGRKAQLVAGQVLLELPKAAFFEDAYVWAASETPGKASAWPPGLVPQSQVFRFEPATLPLDQGFWLGLRWSPAGAAAGGAAQGREGVALYRDDGEDWSYVGAEPRAEGSGTWIGADVKRLSRFALARDTAPPAVEWLSPPSAVASAGATGATPGKTTGARPLLRARVRDDQSGFREDDLTFLVDGRRVPSEWDPDTSDLRYEPRSPLAAGRHVLIVEAKDRAGLVTRRERAITVR